MKNTHAKRIRNMEAAPQNSPRRCSALVLASPAVRSAAACDCHAVDGSSSSSNGCDSSPGSSDKSSGSSRGWSIDRLSLDVSDNDVSLRCRECDSENLLVWEVGLLRSDFGLSSGSASNISSISASDLSRAWRSSVINWRFLLRSSAHNPRIDKNWQIFKKMNRLRSF